MLNSQVHVVLTDRTGEFEERVYLGTVAEALHYYAQNLQIYAKDHTLRFELSYEIENKDFHESLGDNLVCGASDRLERKVELSKRKRESKREKSHTQNAESQVDVAAS